MNLTAEYASSLQYQFGRRLYHTPPAMAGMSEISAVFCLAEHFFLEQV
jgi:hypothetical protein